MNIVDFLADRTAAARGRLTPERFYPLLLAVLVLAGLAVFLLPGIPGGNDLYYHFSRLYAMCEDFRLGEIPAMINHEALSRYGYATGLFYPDAFLYPCVLLMLCGMGIVAAYKCFVAAWMLFTAFGAYHCARRLSATPFGNGHQTRNGGTPRCPFPGSKAARRPLSARSSARPRA